MYDTTKKSLVVRGLKISAVVIALAFAVAFIISSGFRARVWPAKFKPAVAQKAPASTAKVSMAINSCAQLSDKLVADTCQQVCDNRRDMMVAVQEDKKFTQADIDAMYSACPNDFATQLDICNKNPENGLLPICQSIRSAIQLVATMDKKIGQPDKQIPTLYDGARKINNKIGEPRKPGDTLFGSGERHENTINNIAKQMGITPSFPESDRKTAIEEVAKQMGITPPPPGKKIAITPPPAGGGQTIVTSGGGCSSKDALATGMDTMTEMSQGFCDNAKALKALGRSCFKYDVNWDTVVNITVLCKQGNEKGFVKLKNTVSRSVRSHTTDDLQCGWGHDFPLRDCKGGDPMMSLQGGAATVGFWKGIVYENWVPSKWQDKIGGRNPVSSSITGNNNKGTGPAEPTPHVTDGSPGSGQDGGGYSGSVLGTTGNQNYSNASVGLTPVAAFSGAPPAMTNGAVDLKGELVQGKSGTPVFTPMGTKTSTSSTRISGMITDTTNSKPVSQGILGD